MLRCNPQPVGNHVPTLLVSFAGVAAPDVIPHIVQPIMCQLMRKCGKISAFTCSRTPFPGSSNLPAIKNKSPVSNGALIGGEREITSFTAFIRLLQRLTGVLQVRLSLVVELPSPGVQISLLLKTKGPFQTGHSLAERGRLLRSRRSFAFYKGSPASFKSAFHL